MQSDRGLRPSSFGPGTLWRTWGSRPLPPGFGGTGKQANKNAAGFAHGGLLVNTGNHLRSHTLTRAVPSPARSTASRVRRVRRPHARLNFRVRDGNGRDPSRYKSENLVSKPLTYSAQQEP